MFLSETLKPKRIQGLFEGDEGFYYALLAKVLLGNFRDQREDPYPNRVKTPRLCIPTKETQK